jgi:hypothetical protein
MEPTPVHTQQTASSRASACLWCHEITSLSEILRNHGFCSRCVRDNCEISWRVVYDRDRKIGKIPRNLRVAYRL